MNETCVALALAGAHPANHVFYVVRSFHGSTLGVLQAPYDGSEPSMLEAAIRLKREAFERFGYNYSNGESLLVATNATGTPAWAISPNLEHVAPAGSREARYIFGDLSCAPEELP